MRPKHMIFIMLVFVCLALTSCQADDQANEKHPEKWYQSRWCAEHDGQAEVVLPDRTRCDCLTETHAIEFDFARKWAEAIGQSLHYAALTGRRAGVVLIMKGKKDEKCWARLLDTIEYHGLPIDAWRMETKDWRIARPYNKRYTLSY